MQYFVSRQCYWPEGTLIVEVAAGGLDYSGADMLTPKYRSLGESEEYNDPREAVDAAIKVRDAWKNDKPDEEIHLGYGHTGGFGLQFEPSEDDEAIAWAEKAYEKLPKCDHCGDVLGKHTYTNEYSLVFETKFCSENCAEMNYEFEEKESKAIDQDN